MAAASPTPKDVVMVIDTSASMTNRYNSLTYITYVKQAAIAVLETLNPNDRVSVLLQCPHLEYNTMYTHPKRFPHSLLFLCI